MGYRNGIIGALAIAGLAACEAPDDSGPAQAAGTPEIGELLGAKIGDRLTLVDAGTRDGAVLLRMRHDEPMAELTSRERDRIAFDFDRIVPTQLCAAPRTRALIEEGGGVLVEIASQDGETFIERKIAQCS